MSEARGGRQRYYMPRSGRFLTPDPYRASVALTNPQTWNRYAYVAGDPVNFVDPWGLFLAAPEEVELARLPMQAVVPWSWIAGGGGGGGGYDPEDDAERTGGATSHRKLIVDNLSKEGPEQGAILGRLRELLEIIDSECERWLGSGFRPYVETLLGVTTGRPYIAHGVFRNRPFIAAFTGTGQTNIPADYAAVVINDQGAFFRRRAPGGGVFEVGGKYVGGTTVAQAFILLHELAHGVGAPGVKPDYGNMEAGRRNDKLVLKHCNRTLEKFR